MRQPFLAAVFSLAVASIRCASENACSDRGCIAPISVQAWSVSGELQYIGVYRDGKPVANAVVTVNGTHVDYVAQVGAYWGTVPVPAGDLLRVVVTAGDAVVGAEGVVPAVPTIALPTDGASLSGDSPITLAWTYDANPTLQFVTLASWPAPDGVHSEGVVGSVPPSARTHTFTAGAIPSGSAVLSVSAVNDATLSGNYTREPTGADKKSYFQVSSAAAAVSVTIL